jgi:two-component system chemotaxis response regulator CheY
VDASLPRGPGVATDAREAEPKHILVIDDESGVRHLLTELLVGEGYVVSEAQDGVRGLERLRDVTPDLIILDMMMPIVSGWAFVEERRRMDICGDVPIIAISAMFDLKSAAAKLDTLGVRAYLPKPFDVDALLALVAQLA